MENKLLYDSFNARYLSPKEVAESFIQNTFFDELLKNTHSLLMGPRGCGKTTLLKMLTPTSLHYWDKKHNTTFVSDLPFFGVYIATDIHWKKQLDQLTEEFANDPICEQLSRASITINILLSLVKTFGELTLILQQEKETDFTENEIEICKLLIDHLRFTKPMSPTFQSLELHLLQQIARLNIEIKKARTITNYSIKLDDFFFSDFFDLVKIACTAFENHLPINKDKRWALCFDELEIAPQWLQEELLQYLRSRNQKILIKVTTAPMISLLREIKSDFTLEASENNDFTTIKIWTSNQKDFKTWKSFCDQLIRIRINRKFSKPVDPIEIFGPSHYERVLEQSFKRIHLSDGLDFSKNTRTWYLLKDLARMDLSFKSFLINKGISPSNPIPTSLEQKDSVFRKIKQLAVYRYQFKKEGSSKRSRKVIPLFYGIPLIYELCDGNPRMLIGVIDELLNIALQKPEGARSLSINEQSKVMIDMSHKYLQVTSAHPDANVNIRGMNVNISEILKKIGDYFHNKMVNEDFTMDPTGSFRVDEEIDNKLLDLLELAIYLGAIVYLDNEDIFSVNGLFNKRLRLSYILSPYFSLLSRDFKEVHLSTLLGKSQSNLTKLKKSNNPPHQQQLFNLDDY